MVLSATLVATRVTVRGVAIVAGAVYNPAAVRVPAAGVDQVTPELQVPTTSAVNCCDCDAVSAIAAGLTITAWLSAKME